MTEEHVYALSLTRAQHADLRSGRREADGDDGAALAGALHTVLEGLAALRSGTLTWERGGPDEHPAGLADWDRVAAAAALLETALRGVEAAAIRQIAARPGGSVTHLGEVTGRSRQTAQRRRERAIGTQARPRQPDPREQWAATGLPELDGLLALPGAD